MKKIISLLLAATLLFGFSAGAGAEAAADTVYASYLIATGSVRMTAHRGYSAAAPENTLPAFRLAGEYGFWGVECDVSPTADGVWVIMHDSTVDRMTDGEGRVDSFTYEELCALTVDAGNNVERYPGTKVPTLTEYLDVCKEYGMHPVIEIKGSAAVEDMDSLAALLSAREEKAMFTVITFEQPLAVRIKALLPDTPVYLLIGGVSSEEFADGVRFCVENDLDGVDFHLGHGKDQVKSLREAGLKAMVWTVDDMETVEQFYRWGVRDFTTNALTPAVPEENLFLSAYRTVRDCVYKLCERVCVFFAPLSGVC